jgi:hypothetical protein
VRGRRCDRISSRKPPRGRPTRSLCSAIFCRQCAARTRPAPPGPLNCFEIRNEGSRESSISAYIHPKGRGAAFTRTPGGIDNSLPTDEKVAAALASVTNTQVSGRRNVVCIIRITSVLILTKINLIGRAHRVPQHLLDKTNHEITWRFNQAYCPVGFF